MADVGKKWVIWLIRQEVGNMTDVARSYGIIWID